MNTNSALEGPLARVFQSLYDTIARVYSHVYVYAQGHGSGAGTEITRNVIFIATNAESPPTRDELIVKSGQFDQTHAEGRKDLFGVAEDLVPLEELKSFARGPALTDSYNPIDTYAFKGVLPRAR